MEKQERQSRIKGLICKLRIVSKKTQASIAKEMGISQQSFCSIESGKTELQLNTIEKICQIFSITEISFFSTIYDKDVVIDFTLAESLRLKV